MSSQLCLCGFKSNVDFLWDESGDVILEVREMQSSESITFIIPLRDVPELAAWFIEIQETITKDYTK